MNKVAVIHNPHSPESVLLSQELTGWLRARGIDAWRGSSAEGREPHILDGVDLIVALGGDGTVLRAAHLAMMCGAPVLPVALGHLNFMSELLPESLYDGMARQPGPRRRGDQKHVDRPARGGRRRRVPQARPLRTHRPHHLGQQSTGSPSDPLISGQPGPGPLSRRVRGRR